MLKTKIKIQVEAVIEYDLYAPEPATGYHGDIDIYNMYIDNEKLSQNMEAEIEKENHFIITDTDDGPRIGVLHTPMTNDYVLI